MKGGKSFSLLVQSGVLFSITKGISWTEYLVGEKIQFPQSAEKRDVILHLSSPPTTGIATPGFAGFSKSGRYVRPSTPSTSGDRLKNLNCTSKWAKQSSEGI